MSKSYLKFLLAFLAIFFTAWGGYFVWVKYFKYDPVKVYQEAERKYVEAMTADTYGGKTPQETLDMFVEALRAEDIELASKYFLLDENLSREKWIGVLVKLKESNKLLELASLLEKVAPSPEDSINENDFKFVFFDADGIVLATLNFQLNTRSQVWKIESL